MFLWGSSILQSQQTVLYLFTFPSSGLESKMLPDVTSQIVGFHDYPFSMAH